MIYITFKGVEYEIPYDRETLKINRMIDSTFDNGYFESAPLTALGTLDVSRRIPRGLLVRVVYDGTEFIFKTGETHMNKLSYGATPKYKHRINLISLSKDMTRKPLENITVTQPKGDFGQYSRSVNEGYLSLWSSTTPVVISYTNLVNSNLSKINGLSIVSLEAYKIALAINFTYEPSIVDINITVNIKYGGVSVKSKVYNFPASAIQNVNTLNDTILFNYTPISTTSFTVEVSRDTALDTLMQLDTTFSITAVQVIDKPIRTYAQVIDKMLLRSEYVLSAESRSRLNLTAPEDKYEEYTLHDALSKIGGYVGALYRVGDLIYEIYWKTIGTTTEDIEGDSTLDFSPYEYPLGTVLKVGGKYYTNVESTTTQRREVYFDFFDRPNTFIPVGVNDISEQAELEDYVSAIELNTKNVIKPIRYSPFRDGYKGLRNISGVGQFTTDDIGFETEDKIERPTQVLFKGMVSRNASNTITYDATDVTDITERVLEKKQWDTLSSEADYSYTAKQELYKNNTLYYIQGDNKIYGMAYYGDTEGRVIGDASVVRALYETVLAVRSVESGELITRTGTQSEDDPGLTGDLAVLMHVAYSNQTQSRARLYKDDQSGFETELIKYFNESSNVNDSVSIGNYAQQIVNRLGGTKHSVSGVVDSLDDIAELGDIDDEGRVYTIIELSLGKRIKYQYTLVQDYNVISSYIGVQSRHRVEEISSDSSTIRTLRYVSKFIFTDTQETFSTRLIRSEDILGSLLAETSDGLTYGYLECNLSNGEVKKIHLSVDSDSKGKTIEIKWGLPNNYSAGKKRYSFVRGSDTIWLNLDVPYTDYYGKVNDILFLLYYNNAGTLNQDLYPEASSTDGDSLFTVITDTIDKDAGETLHGLLEIPILSENSKVRVYNGFARWNKIVEGTDRIRACALYYTPIKNAQKVDLSRVEDLAVTGTASFGKLDLNFTLTSTAVGIAYYNTDTLDLLLVYIDNLTAQEHNISLYYKVQDSIFGSGASIVSQLNMPTITVDIIPSYYRSKDIADSALQETSVDIIPSGFPSTDHQGTGLQETDVTIIVSYGRSTNYESAELQTTEITITPQYTRSNDFGGTGLQEISISNTYQAIRFKDGGTSPSGGTTCTSIGDIGNTVCDSSQSCSFVSQSSYYSATDDTLIPGCTAGVERIQCMPDGGGYFCVISEGRITTTYSNCKTCEVV